MSDRARAWLLVATVLLIVVVVVLALTGDGGTPWAAISGLIRFLGALARAL